MCLYPRPNEQNGRPLLTARSSEHGFLSFCSLLGIPCCMVCSASALGNQIVGLMPTMPAPYEGLPQQLSIISSPCSWGRSKWHPSVHCVSRTSRSCWLNAQWILRLLHFHQTLLHALIGICTPKSSRRSLAYGRCCEL